ncbi:MAG: hypothetical protein D3911_13935, partial [Candidatus Electrothrix sp. AW3_4]|nr:hypothetical protein [Candidatus Electrothrix gigas]
MFDRRDIVEDELFLIRDSGELPEITYHSSLYYLTTDKDGPGLILTQDEQELLQAAALERCQQIILRDLLPENRNLSLYRGLRRSIFNWQRYCKCCQRMGRQIDEAFRDRVAHALAEFIQQEMIDVRHSKPPSKTPYFLDSSIYRGSSPTSITINFPDGNLVARYVN